MLINRSSPSLRFLVVTAVLLGCFFGSYCARNEKKWAYSAIRDAYKIVGSANGDRNELGKAKKILDDILTADPQNPVALFLKGWSFQQQGQSMDAIQTYETLYPHLSEIGGYAHFNEAVLLEVQGKNDDALFHYQSSISNNANLYDAWKKLIALLIRTGDIKGADEYLSMAKSVMPNDPQILEFEKQLSKK